MLTLQVHDVHLACNGTSPCWLGVDVLGRDAAWAMTEDCKVAWFEKGRGTYHSRKKQGDTQRGCGHSLFIRLR